jgi:hypothetical protein
MSNTSKNDQKSQVNVNIENETPKITTPKKDNKKWRENRKTKQKTQPIIISAKYDVESGVVFQRQQISTLNDGTFEKQCLQTNLDIPHAYKHVVNQVFKMASLLNQKGTIQERVNDSVRKLEKLIELSTQSVVANAAKDSVLGDDVGDEPTQSNIDSKEDIVNPPEN